MSADLVAYIEKKTEDGKWELLDLYTKDGLPVFSYLTDNLARDIIFNHDTPLTDGRRGLPKDTNEEIVEEWGDYNELCTYFDWCELKALARTPEAMDKEYDFDGNIIEEFNALESLVKMVSFIIEGNRIYFTVPGDIRIICCLSI